MWRLQGGKKRGWVFYVSYLFAYVYRARRGGPEEIGVGLSERGGVN